MTVQPSKLHSSTVRRTIVAWSLVATFFLLTSWHPSEAASRPRRGGACALRLTGIVMTGPPQLMCVPILNCSGRTLRRVWVLLGATEGYPSLAERVRYGNCRRPVSPATTTTVVVPEIAEGDGQGARCLIGKWEFGGANMRNYLNEATGNAPLGDFQGTIMYRFSGTVNGDQVAGGDIVGSGTMTGSSPDGVVRGVITAIPSARFDATNNSISFRGASALFIYKLTINGVEQPIQQLDFDGANTIAAYECSGSRLRFPVNIPGIEGVPPRTANMIMTRTA